MFVAKKKDRKFETKEIHISGLFDFSALQNTEERIRNGSFTTVDYSVHTGAQGLFLLPPINSCLPN